MKKIINSISSVALTFTLLTFFCHCSDDKISDKLIVVDNYYQLQTSIDSIRCEWWGDSSVISINASDNTSWEIRDIPSWVTLSHSKGVGNENSLTITIAYNDGVARTAVINLVSTSPEWSFSKQIKIKQSGSPEYVDLGLSVNWATCNYGASSPESYGTFYAWGEVEKKYNYTWSTYKYCKGSMNTLTKYCSSSSYGYNSYNDTKTILDVGDDVVDLNWGGLWRMPTADEFQELIDNCTWTKTSIGKVTGYKVVSNLPGYTNRSIFFPNAGHEFGTNRNNQGDYGYYWSSSLASVPYVAKLLYCDSKGPQIVNNDRFYGYQVRPVFPNENRAIDVISITLDKNNLSLVVGETRFLTATINPSNATYKTVSWLSRDNSVVTVNSDGLITAVGPGSTKITATAGGQSDSCLVKVIESDANMVVESVDLGLSVIWATCNVGANSPEEYGGYYAWGEIETKSNYDWSSYIYCEGYSSTALTKYCYDGSYGKDGYVDNKSVLDFSDDVVHENLGGSWRIPTKEEFQELIDKCSWEYVKVNGVNGYKVTSKRTGFTDRYIFLPAAGYKFYTSLSSAGSSCCYWSSSLYSASPQYAYEFVGGRSELNYEERFIGLSIRPVCPNVNWDWVDITGINLDSESLTLEIDDEQLITASVIPSNASVNTVTWTTSDKNVATVSTEGVVTAKNPGFTIITATSSNSAFYASCTVTVKEPNPVREYVDLGLSVKWATCNVGANRPEVFGCYYAWGEVETKNIYNIETYKFSQGTEKTLTKYCNISEYGYNGYYDDKTKLDAIDDVAQVKWGETWRMPTSGEFQELMDSCTWTWTTLNGVKGYNITSNRIGYTEQSIFLPAAGRYSDNSNGVSGIVGRYWSSTLDSEDPDNAFRPSFSSSSYSIDNNDRYMGLSVRPVHP